MRSDLPQLMIARKLNAIVVQGNTDTSSDLAYICPGAKLEGALYLHRQEEEPILFVNAIEREVAAMTGHEVKLWTDYDLIDYLKAHDNDRFAAQVAIMSDLLQDHNVSGRVGFYGSGDRGYSYIFLKALSEANPQIEVVGEPEPNLFTVARETKDGYELAAMKAVAKQTTEVIDAVIAFIQAQSVHSDGLVKEDGSPVTIGDVKALIRMELARRNLEEAHENIFSQGRDAGVPHNTGQLDMQLRLGQPIIFDIFPRDPKSGYFHDITRTFFIGYVPDDLAIRWQQIKTIYDALLADMRVGERCSYYQNMTCDYFEDLGYPSTRSDPKTQVGYSHSLGHGVGLDIHEQPMPNHHPDNDTIFQPGHVVSVEPGLYNPDEGWGMRIEDTVAFDAEGSLVNLSDYPYQMVIPLS